VSGPVSSGGDDDKPRYSGQVRLRMPAGLHRDITSAAAKEGVSMNQFICTVLAGAVGWTAVALEQKRKYVKPVKRSWLDNLRTPEEVLRLATAGEEVEE
jgi:hypothetical protein